MSTRRLSLPALARKIASRGFRALRRASGRRPPPSAQDHFAHVTALAGRELAGRYAAPPLAPTISFVTPLYDTPPAYLDDLLASFRAQAPGWAELVLSDDGSTSQPTAAWLAAHAGEPGLRILRSAVNRGIAAACNAGIAAARGAWIGVVDHDDALAPHAVAALLRAIEDNPQARFLYTDEAIADGQLRVVDFFDKPAFDDVLLSGVNYINHLSLYRRDLLAEIGGFREGFDGSQDYDLLLRALARLRRDQIRHLPYPAYLWRRDGRSFSVKHLDRATANARRALEQTYGAEVDPALLPDLHRVRFAPRATRVSVILTGRCAPEGRAGLLEALRRHAEVEVIAEDAEHASPASQFNRGAARARGDVLLRLADDLQPISPDWIAEMVSCLAYPDVGIVGARLLAPDGTLAHAGLVDAQPWYAGQSGDFPGPMGRLAVRSILPAVSGACLLVSRACWDAAGPFDETLVGDDVAFCARARAAGLRTLYTPFATLRGPAGAPPEIRPRPAAVDPTQSPWVGAHGRLALDALPPAR